MTNLVIDKSRDRSIVSRNTQIFSGEYEDENLPELRIIEDPSRTWRCQRGS